MFVRISQLKEVEKRLAIQKLAEKKEKLVGMPQLIRIPLVGESLVRISQAEEEEEIVVLMS
jgi:hypothetical protein